MELLWDTFKIQAKRIRKKLVSLLESLLNIIQVKRIQKKSKRYVVKGITHYKKLMLIDIYLY